jgi:prepilin peptidase CpaA
MTTTLYGGALLALMGLAALSDLRTRRIPNAITVVGLLLALALRATLGAGALGTGVAGAGVALAVVLPLFALRGMGGGDAKLLIMAGAFLGAGGFFVALLATFLFGGIMSVVAATRRGVIVPLLLNTFGLACWLVTLGRRGERPVVESAGALKVPYGVAIALGAVVALYAGATL